MATFIRTSSGLTGVQLDSPSIPILRAKALGILSCCLTGKCRILYTVCRETQRALPNKWHLLELNDTLLGAVQTPQGT